MRCQFQRTESVCVCQVCGTTTRPTERPCHTIYKECNPAAKPRMPGVGQRVVSAGAAAIGWMAAGAPLRPEADRQRADSICRACDYRTTDGACLVCGCYLAPKTAMATERCPAGKWGWKFEGIQLVRGADEWIGQNYHRSGWPAAMAALAGLHGPRGILFEDFAEQRFCYPQPGPLAPILRPWVGVFHHPWGRHELMANKDMPQNYFARDEWQQSVRYLRLALFFSDWARAAYAPRMNCPTLVVRHPTAAAERWEFARWRAEPTLAQVGWYLRNTRAIHQVAIPHNVARVKLWPGDYSWIHDWDDKVARWWRARGDRTEVAGHQVAQITRLPDAAYDRLMAGAVVLSEVFDSSANNVTVECIARATPLLINRHPAVVEYLGTEYPGYWSDPTEVAALLEPARVAAIHEYLVARGSADLSFEAWKNNVGEAVAALAANCPP